MHKRTIISGAIGTALAFSGSAGALEFGGVEVSGYLRNITSVFTRSGLTNNGATSMLDDQDHKSGDVLSFENSARFFLNGDIGDMASWHADINLIYDTEGVNEGSIDYRDHKNYSQYDYLRELYVDATVADWDVRLGKQQVVWGTADGIKLLDIINPTDFRFLNQSTMEDSRIPVWMLNTSSDVTSNGNLQFIVSQVQENLIPGLNQGGDPGQPFVLKGVATITGETGGFLNVAPALANVAGSFTNATQIPAFPDGLGGFVPNPLASPFGLVPFSGFTVDAFANSPSILPFGNEFGYQDLSLITQCGLDPTCTSDPNANQFVTNLMPVNSIDPTDSSWNPSNVSSAFEHMPMASFATFNTFATFVGTDPNTGLPVYTGATSSYRRDYPSDSNVNAGFRWKQFLDNGLNYSLNYFYHYGANPDINLSWHDAVTGEMLSEQLSPAGDFINNETGAPGPDGFPDLADFTQSLTPAQLPTDLTTQLPATTLLVNGAGQFYGAFDPTGGTFPGGYNSNPVELRFTETLHRMHSIGASFDYAVDTDFAPVVLRGEFLYDKDDKQPVVNRQLLSSGALASSLVMEDADYFKYVLGVDVTVMTNLLVSGQFIQYLNLDYVHDKRRCTTQTGVSVECSRYTADFANISITNGLQRGYKNKEFYSLFFSKPFGEAQRGRWNNITIYEEGGGWWNRFDVEYSFSDNLVGSLAWNNYWGDEDTTFGQFKDSSNFGLGVKYIFD